ncbi:hypothetical protein [Streptomyces sp. SAI-149]|uniref:hypothetical protein n=1 Tax=Streptomyces sp. SAI-149 TaxID=2940542 RepID=UPI002473AD36|nr:hypothetical protein [Streptomyces sp. SAI-149]MDH6499513.1 hypothetical protein [Streptomyces sp. SAI-149]
MGIFRTSEMRAFTRSSQKINFAELKKAPQRFLGVRVVLRGYVKWIQEDARGTLFSLDVEESKIVRNVSQRCDFLVSYPDSIDALPGDLLDAYGEISGVSRDFEDGWGMPLIMPTVYAKIVDVYGKRQRY